MSISVLYTADEGPRAETSCNQLLINSATYLLTINSPICWNSVPVNRGLWICHPCFHDGIVLCKGWITAYLNVLRAQHTDRTVLQTHTHITHANSYTQARWNARTHIISLQIHSLPDPQTFQCYASKFLNCRWIYIHWWPAQSGLLLTVDYKSALLAWITTCAYMDGMGGPAIAGPFAPSFPPILHWNGDCKFPILTNVLYCFHFAPVVWLHVTDTMLMLR